MKRELKHENALKEATLTNLANCRAYPDEKGIETTQGPDWRKPSHHHIAEPIPMKRELKRERHFETPISDETRLQSLSR